MLPLTPDQLVLLCSFFPERSFPEPTLGSPTVRGPGGALWPCLTLTARHSLCFSSPHSTQRFLLIRCTRLSFMVYHYCLPGSHARIQNAGTTRAGTSAVPSASYNSAHTGGTQGLRSSECRPGAHGSLEDADEQTGMTHSEVRPTTGDGQWLLAAPQRQEPQRRHP